ncbi:MAG: CCA tRNA nucleotidyltransferase [Desulfobacterales bacterium]|nr:CCA tRNA nucleotidyltransferase [Desulfobacterales bacterium]
MANGITENHAQMHGQLLKAAGLFPSTGGAFLVGGCVRDLLAGEPPADYDLAVSGPPAAYARQMADKHGGRPVAIGPERHSFFRVVAGGRIFDISPLVGDSIKADLRNRDFTINAMAFDLAQKALIDPEDGLADLKNRVIRLVSPDAFVNDPLRLLRAFRMAAQFRGRIEAQTRLAIKAAADSIKTCAGERVRAELLKTFMFPDSAKALAQMADCGLLFAVIPELLPLADCRQNVHHSFNAWTHTLAAGRHLEALIDPGNPDNKGAWLHRAATRVQRSGQSGLLKLALLLHDIGKPDTRSTDAKGQIHFYGHGRRGVKITLKICRRLKCSRRETAYITGIIKNHNRPLFLFLLHKENRLSDRAVTRFFIQCAETTPDILLHAVADFAGKRRTPGTDLADFYSFINTLLERYFNTHTHRVAGPGLLSGHDLMAAFDLPPSPLFRKILDRVETARLAGEISEKRQALELVRRLLDLADHPSRT